MEDLHIARHAVNLRPIEPTIPINWTDVRERWTITVHGSSHAVRAFWRRGCDG